MVYFCFTAPFSPAACPDNNSRVTSLSQQSDQFVSAPTNVRLKSKTMDCRIYKRRSEPEKHLWLTLVNSGESEQLEGIYEAQEYGNNWVPLKVEKIIETESDLKKSLGDFPGFWSVPTVSKKALNALNHYFIDGVESLPLSGEDFYVLNVLNLTNALDEESS